MKAEGLVLSLDFNKYVYQEPTNKNLIVELFTFLHLSFDVLDGLFRQCPIYFNMLTAGSCRVHSLSSGKVAATPILKSVPSQFSPFILEITVLLHAYKTILAQSRPQKLRQRENYSNLLSLDG